MTTIHPNSLPITPGWSQIGPVHKRPKQLSPREVSQAFQATLKIRDNPRISKLRNQLAKGHLNQTEAIIGLLENTLTAKQRFVSGANS